MQQDRIEIFLACEKRRQLDAIVIATGLGAEDRDCETLRRASNDLFDRTRTGHAIADHDETLFAHRVESVWNLSERRAKRSICAAEQTAALRMSLAVKAADCRCAVFGPSE